MRRTAVNPWSWSLRLGYNQAEVLDDVTRHLNCAGQTAVDENGQPQYEGNMREQLNLALNNLELVLGAARMSLRDVTRLAIYTTDVDEALRQYDVLAERLGREGVAPPVTLLGVVRLALPGLMIEIEATAAA